VLSTRFECCYVVVGGVCSGLIAPRLRGRVFALGFAGAVSAIGAAEVRRLVRGVLRLCAGGSCRGVLSARGVEVVSMCLWWGWSLWACVAWPGAVFCFLCVLDASRSLWCVVVEWFWRRRVCGCGVSAFSMLMSWGLGRDGGLCGV